MCRWRLLNTCTWQVHVLRVHVHVQTLSIQPAVYIPIMSTRSECMDANTRRWTGVQKRRNQWFWSICCSCAKERCCCWASTSTSAKLYVMALLDLFVDFLELLCRYKSTVILIRQYRFSCSASTTATIACGLYCIFNFTN